MDPEDRRLLYQNAIEDTRYHKNNQWRISHYGLLVQAALVAIDGQKVLPTTLSDLPTLGAHIQNSVFSILAWVVFGYALYLIHESQWQIVKWRRATKSLREESEWKNRSIEEWYGKWSPRNQTSPGLWDFREIWKRDQQFKYPFLAVQLIALILAILIIC